MLGVRISNEVSVETSALYVFDLGGGAEGVANL